MLLAAAGVSNADIARRVGVSGPTVLTWRNRYRDGGLDALGDLPRSGRPPVHDEVSILAASLAAPPERLGVTHWSSRLLADELGVSFATVARVWRKWNVQPRRVETFKFSTDPALEAKIRDVVGLYLAPPDKAVVVSIDEKSQIGLPLETWGLDHSGRCRAVVASGGSGTMSPSSSWTVITSSQQGQVRPAARRRQGRLQSVHHCWPR